MFLDPGVIVGPKWWDSLVSTLEMDPEGCERQLARLQEVRSRRDSERVSVVLEALIAEIDPDLADTSESKNAGRYDTLREMTPDELAKEFGGYEAHFVASITAEFDGQTQPITVEQGVRQ